MVHQAVVGEAVQRASAGFRDDDAARARGEALLPCLPVIRVLSPPPASAAARRGGRQLQGDVGRRSQAAANGALALILGPLRAAALQALHQPLTVSELAAAVQCAPTTATYHLHQLA